MVSVWTSLHRQAQPEEPHSGRTRGEALSIPMCNLSHSVSLKEAKLLGVEALAAEEKELENNILVPSAAARPSRGTA